MTRSRTIWMFVLAVCLAPFSSSAIQSDPREKISIDRISDMLVRVGETRLATRLRRDFSAGRIEFGALHAGESAAAGKDFTDRLNRKPNKMTLNREKVFQQVADYRSASGANPLLLGWAATVAHEYVHMDQVNPTHTSRHETPAWLESSAALRRWVGVFQRDYERAKTLKEPARSKQLAELENYISELVSLAGSMHGDLQSLINNRNAVGMRSPIVDPKKSYGFQSIRAQAEALLRNVRALRSQVAATPGRTGTRPTPAKPRFSWRREASGFKLNYPDQLANYKASHDLSVSGVEGVITFGYKQGEERAKFSLTWNPLSDRMTPGETVRITLKVADIGCTASQIGSGGGRVEAWMESSPGGSWDRVLINQPMIAIKGHDAPQSYDYVLAVPQGRPGQKMVVKVTAWDTLIGSEFAVVYVCE